MARQNILSVSIQRQLGKLTRTDHSPDRNANKRDKYHKAEDLASQIALTNARKELHC